MLQESPITCAFKSEYIDRMIDNKRRYNLENDIDTIFITIDPSAGTGRSLYVILSMFYPMIEKDKRMCVV